MLKKIISNIGNFAVSVALVSLACFTVFSFFSSKSASKKIAELNTSIRIHTQEIKFLSEHSASLAEENKGLVEQIKKLKDETKANSIAITKGVTKAQELASTRPPAPEECTPIIEHMEAEIEAWKDNFSLAIKDRDTWKTIAEDFDLAYKNQVIITDNLQKTIDMIASDSAKKDEIIKDLKKSVAINKLKGNLVAGGMVAIVIAAAIWGIMK